MRPREQTGGQDTAGLREAERAALAGSTVGDGIDSVVTYHLNPYASGVVRFNELLAENLGVPFMGLGDREALSAVRHPLLSFKVSEMGDGDRDALAAVLDDRDWGFELYLHDWFELPLERRLVAEAVRVWCGNDEIHRQVAPLSRGAETVWTPGLLMDHRSYQPAEVSVFSFGMAHKIQTGRFRRLRELLETSGRSYAVYVSGATHETRSIGDAQDIYEEMNDIFPRSLYFLGNLSDVAVYNQLQQSTFFAAFFPHGVRANNTSVAAAMEQGSIVITNLDEHSPSHLVHMQNVIDINRLEELPADPLLLKRISLGAMEAARARSWPALTARLGG